MDERAVRSTLDSVYRSHGARVLATLVRLLGDLDLAEDAMQGAVRAALEQWPRDGVPANPSAWLVSTARFKAIDHLRRRAMFRPLGEAELALAVADGHEPPEDVPDDQLRLIFMCCHPEIDPAGRVALTLREVCGLTTDQIASAFLVPRATIAQRIVRAKRRIRERNLRFELPARHHLRARLDAVLHVAYLTFNEGYSASSGESVTRIDLAAEAIRLTRLVCELLPDSETYGLLALMLLQHSRRNARTTEDGDLVRLEDQNRALWDTTAITEGNEALQLALRSGPIGPYTLQAAIAAQHATAASVAATDWTRIATLYELLQGVSPSPVVELNRAIAVAMRDGPAAGIALIRDILARGDLSRYHLAHAALGDLLRRAGENGEAIAAFRRALELAQQEPEKRYLRRQIAALSAQASD